MTPPKAANLFVFKHTDGYESTMLDDRLRHALRIYVDTPTITAMKVYKRATETGEYTLHDTLNKKKA